MSGIEVRELIQCLNKYKNILKIMDKRNDLKVINLALDYLSDFENCNLEELKPSIRDIDDINLNIEEFVEKTLKLKDKIEEEVDLEDTIMDVENVKNEVKEEDEIKKVSSKRELDEKRFRQIVDAYKKGNLEIMESFTRRDIISDDLINKWNNFSASYKRKLTLLELNTILYLLTKEERYYDMKKLDLIRCIESFVEDIRN